MMTGKGFTSWRAQLPGSLGWSKEGRNIGSCEYTERLNGDYKTWISLHIDMFLDLLDVPETIHLRLPSKSPLLSADVGRIPSVLGFAISSGVTNSFCWSTARHMFLVASLLDFRRRNASFALHVSSSTHGAKYSAVPAPLKFQIY